MAKRNSKKTVSRRDSRAARKHARMDGYFNEFSGHGTERDRRSYNGHNSVAVPDGVAMSMWSGDDIMARIIEMKPDEAVRRGIQLKISSSKKKDTGKELAEQVMAELERLDMLVKVKLAGQYERAYGGSAIFPVIEGAVGDLSEDLEPYRKNIVKVTALHVLEARELRPASWYTDITSPKFRQPETYRLWPLAGASGTQLASEIIHESRLILFPGIRVSNQLQPGQRPGWGNSVIMRCHEVVSDFGLAWGSAATLLHEFALGVLKIDDLENLLSTKEGKQLIKDKVGLIEMMKSTLKARVIGSKDDYTRQSTPVAGLEGLLVQLAQRLAAAAEMPVTKLMGMSPAGMNATGDADIRGWYDSVETTRTYYRKMVEQIIRLVMLQNDGPTGGEEPDSWSMEWTPLWQPSEAEVATTRKTIADTDKVYFDMGAATAAVIAKSRWGGDTFSGEMHYDPADLDALAAQTNLSGTDPAEMSDEDLAALGVDVEAYRATQAAKAAPAPEGGAPAAAADPNAPIAPGAAAAPENIQSTVLNGAQVSSLVAVVTAVVNGEIPRDAAAKIIELAYQVSPEVATALLGDPNFEKPAPAIPPALAAHAGIPVPGAKPGEKVDEKTGEPPKDGAVPPKAKDAQADDKQADEPSDDGDVEPDPEDPNEDAEQEPPAKKKVTAKKKAKAEEA